MKRRLIEIGYAFIFVAVIGLMALCSSLQSRTKQNNDRRYYALRFATYCYEYGIEKPSQEDWDNFMYVGPEFYDFQVEESQNIADQHIENLGDTTIDTVPFFPGYNYNGRIMTKDPIIKVEYYDREDTEGIMFVGYGTATAWSNLPDSIKALWHYGK